MKSNAEKQTAGLQKFRDAFKPRAAFIVGDGGISLADFLSLDLRTLFCHTSLPVNRIPISGVKIPALVEKTYAVVKNRLRSLFGKRLFYNFAIYLLYATYAFIHRTRCTSTENKTND